MNTVDFRHGSISFRALPVRQPIGDFFIASIPGRSLAEIAWVDVRRMSDEPGEVDNYLGIQRKISPSRVADLRRYVRTADATFPTAIIVAVPGRCARWDSEKGVLTLASFPGDEEAEPVSFLDIAKVLDGQHRLRGFSRKLDGQFEFDLSDGENFDLNVAIFVEADIAQQANIFATVNLAQTKVNKSLVYDLASLSSSRSPQKSAHYVAVSLDSTEGSPFYKGIKRLGVATPGRDDFFESLTQAAFVEKLMGYMSSDPVEDRDFFMKHPGAVLPLPDERTSRKLIFRRLFVQQREVEIAKIVWAYFDAVRTVWSGAWADQSRGNIIRRTNGFRAFMSFLRPCYLTLLGSRDVGEFVGKSEFVRLLSTVSLTDAEFQTNIFPPGTSGEAGLRRRLMETPGLITM